jgi:acyl-CoA dehydrogenase
MEFDLPERARELQATARKFVEEELIPLEAEADWWDADEMPDAIRRPLEEKAKALGLWLLDTPKELGGAGLSQLELCLVWVELYKAGILPNRDLAVVGPDVRILLHCNEQQRDRYLLPVIRGERRWCFAQTEPDAGTDPASMKTRAVWDGSAYVLNGTKRFITAARKADFAQVMAVTEPGKGARGITCFLVDMDTPGVSISGEFQKMMGDRPCQITFENARVPSENVLGGLGRGFEFAQKWITMGRLGQASKALGVADRALEMSARYAKSRVIKGESLAEQQAIQAMLADSLVEVYATRLMLHDAAMRMDRGQAMRNESYMVKLFANEMAGRVLDRAIQIHGARGLTRALPLERWYLDLRSRRITEGASEVMRWVIARNYLREVK